MSTGMLRRHHKANGHLPEDPKPTGTRIADVLPPDPPESTKTDPVKLQSKGMVKPKLTKEAVAQIMKKDERPEVNLDIDMAAE